MLSHESNFMNSPRPTMTRWRTDSLRQERIGSILRAVVSNGLNAVSIASKLGLSPQ